MNLEKLKKAEEQFFKRYPGGFQHPEIIAIAKKHKGEKMTELARAAFAKNNFSDSRRICENMIKVISRSSMVSMFEKPKFRDVVNSLNHDEKNLLSIGLKQFLHGKQQQGFETIVDILRPYKLAKWSLVTIIPNYYHPTTEVFVKPTTTKGVIAQFELSHLQYKPLPTWDFYQSYRKAFLEMKAQVDEAIAPSNAAFGGFLMMSI